jgi:PTH1 family peptidyl-tRNA hydrolase
MRLVVGLGNPDRKYVDTRHNLGYRVCDELCRRWAIDFSREKFQSLVAEVQTPAEKVVLLKPLTYMNLSGQAVAAAVGFYQLDLSDVLVVCDDFNLDLGRLRVRTGGSHGGHNGLRDIIARVGSEQFPRLRLGIGPLPRGTMDPADFCLTGFAPEERDGVKEMIQTAAEAVSVWLDKGIQETMNRFNAKGTTES